MRVGACARVVDGGGEDVGRAPRNQRTKVGGTEGKENDTRASSSRVVRGADEDLVARNTAREGVRSSVAVVARLTQACYAGGPDDFRYLLYKDVNRHPKLRLAPL